MAIFELKEVREAPSGSKGPIHWAKEKLFSSIGNTILTLLGFYLVYMTIPPLLDWMIFDATWSGTKAEITKDGARWIFIIEKFDQFMYGFYPESEHWRILTIVVLFPISIVLFKYVLKTPKAKLALLIAFPIVSFILISGNIFGLMHVETHKWGGLMLTIVVASVGIIASFPIGIMLALGRQSKMPLIRTLCIGFIEFIRGVPLITLLLWHRLFYQCFFMKV